MGKLKTHEEFIKELQEVNPHMKNIQILGKYKTAKTKITCKCLIHEYVWDAQPWSLLQGSGCKKCGTKSGAYKQSNSHEEFVGKMKALILCYITKYFSYQIKDILLI